MEEAKYRIGEKVALKSILRPDLNTPKTTVTKSVYSKDGTCGLLNLAYTGWIYEVSSNNKSWCESALRKLPKKSDDSFNRMMSRLKDGTIVDRSKGGIIEIRREEETIIEDS